MSKLKMCVIRTSNIIRDRQLSMISIRSHVWKHQHFLRVNSNFSSLTCEQKLYSSLQSSTLSLRKFLNSDIVLCQSLKRQLSNRDTEIDEFDNDSDNEEDAEDGIYNKYPHYEVDDDATSEPRHRIVAVGSTRVDAILTKAFNVGRAKMEEKMLEQKCLVNGKLLKKKSYQAKVGDYIDLVQEKTDSQNRVQRVRILDILDGKTKSGKQKIVFRLWKKAFLVDAPYKSDIKY